MSLASEELIDGYLDESLSQEQFQQLNQWIKSDPLHAQRFASAFMLHDRLRNEFAAEKFAVEKFVTEHAITTDFLLASKVEQLSAVTPARHYKNALGRSSIA